MSYRVAALSFALVACAADPPPDPAGSDAGGAPVDAPDAGPAVAPVVLDREISAMTAAVETARVAADLDALVAFESRNTCSALDDPARGIGAAREMLLRRFAALPGVRVRGDEFAQSFCPGAPGPQQNVVAWIPGATQPERLVLIGGHYDSMGSEETLGRVDGSIPAPGANDSGSQTALLLEAARVMAGHAYDATVVFVAFAAEEQGLHGSVHFVRSLGTLFPGAAVEALFNCDVVGGDASANTADALHRFRLYSPGTPREISPVVPDGTEREGLTDDTSPARGLMRYVGAWGAAYVPEMTMVPRLRQDRPGRSGDHASFLDRGLPAVRFIELNEGRAHQHTPDDVVANMTPAYTTRMARVLVGTVASLARAPAPPTGVAATREGDAVALSWEAAPGEVDHYVVAARPVSENLYRRRVAVAGGELRGRWSAAALGVEGAEAFFVSVAAVDAQGHESLFAYPELRCDAAECAVQAGSLEVTRSRRL